MRAHKPCSSVVRAVTAAAVNIAQVEYIPRPYNAIFRSQLYYRLVERGMVLCEVYGGIGSSVDSIVFPNGNE